MPRREFILPKDRYDAMRQQYHAPEENFNLLHSDVQGVREKSGVWDTDYILSKYVDSTEKMIDILDGTIDDRTLEDPSSDRAERKRSHEKPDTVIWLDKSARPVAWFVDALWEQSATPGAQKPNSEFLNIDRVDWLQRQGHRHSDAATRLGAESFNIDAVPEEDILRIRAIFAEGEVDQANWQDSVKSLPTRLDGQNILIVDEVKNKGGTLSIATQLIKRAIPEATVSGEYFWKTNRYSRDARSAGDMQMESAPVWYDRTYKYGRGVGDISHEYFEQLPNSPENFKKKLGWIVLSAPHFNLDTYEIEPDHKADQLRQDIAYMSYAVADNQVLKAPTEKNIPSTSDTAPGTDFTLEEIIAFREKRGQQNDASKK